MRITTAIGILCCVIIGGLFGYINYRIDKYFDNKRKPEDHSEELDSLQRLYNQAHTREQWYLLQLKQDSAGLYQLQQRIKYRDLKIKSYETKLKQVDQLHISNLDSFFIATYPDSLEPRPIN